MAGPRRAPNPGSPRRSAKDRALGLLSVRARSRQELRRRLLAAGYEGEEIDAVLQDLARVGLVDDARFARELGRDRAGRRLEGDRAVRSSLAAKGLDPALVEEVVGELGEEAERAATLAARKATRLATSDPEAAFRRLVGTLVRRGYGPETAREAARRALADVAADALAGTDVAP